MDTESIHPEIAAMVKEILEQYSIGEIMHTSSEVASLYKWVHQIIQKLEGEGAVAHLPTEPTNPNKRMTFRMEKQRAILGIEEEESREWATY